MHGWVLSSYTVDPVFSTRKNSKTYVRISLDLGMSTSEVKISSDFILLPDGTKLHWADLEKVHADRQSCYAVNEKGVRKIESFSQFTNRYYSLFPTSHAPTMLISGIPMHRIKDTHPQQDTKEKIRTARPNGLVLDTSTGLGYTAIESARYADHVITIELDPAVLDICQANPWSAGLFDTSKISQIVGDSYDLVFGFPDETFNTIIHDPPTFSLAGDLYSGLYYEQLYRILRRGGRLFHYIGDLNSHSGKRVARGASQRLVLAGFKHVKSKPKAFALTANKRY